MKQFKIGYIPEWADFSEGSWSPFNQVFKHGVNVLKSGFDGVDCLLLWGGTDIWSGYYNEQPLRNNQCSNQPSRRDDAEYRAMLYAKAHNIPILGVCRGAQFMCAFDGGRVIQHTTGHRNGPHSVTCIKGSNGIYDKDVVEYTTTSCHHQMMYPYEIPHQLLGWSSDRLSMCYLSNPSDNKAPSMFDLMGDKPEPEIVYFPRIRGLGIQGHPEWMSGNHPFVEYCNQLVIDFLLTEEKVGV